MDPMPDKPVNPLTYAAPAEIERHAIYGRPLPTLSARLQNLIRRVRGAGAF